MIKTKITGFLVTQGKNLLMLDKNRKTVRGFNFKQANSEIISQPQHYRIGKKDYLVFKTQTQMYILDRTGNKGLIQKQQVIFRVSLFCFIKINLQPPTRAVI